MLLASPFYPSFFRSCGSVLPFCILAARSVLPFYVLATWSAPALFLSGRFSVFSAKSFLFAMLAILFLYWFTRSGNERVNRYVAHMGGYPVIFFLKFGGRNHCGRCLWPPGVCFKILTALPSCDSLTLCPVASSCASICSFQSLNVILLFELLKAFCGVLCACGRANICSVSSCPFPVRVFLVTSFYFIFIHVLRFSCPGVSLFFRKKVPFCCACYSIFLLLAPVRVLRRQAFKRHCVHTCTACHFLRILFLYLCSLARVRASCFLFYTVLLFS